MNKPTSETLREEIIKEWFKDMQGKSFETRMNAAINKVLDAAVENIDKAGLPVGEKIYAKAAINKLRPGQ